MRLGFAAKALGRPGLKPYDTRRWHNGPHLSVSLAYLRDILAYLCDVNIRLYGMSPNLAPYITHPDLPQFHGQIEECVAELSSVGRMAREANIRLLFHTSRYVALNAQNEVIADKSVADVIALTRILEAMNLGPEAVIVTHIGGTYGDKERALHSFMRAYERLPDGAKMRIALENDSSRFSAQDVFRLCQNIGCRMVFDRLHHLLYNPPKAPLLQCLEWALDTWPDSVTPLIHFSSPCTEMQAVQQRETHVGRMRRPLWSRHSDYVNPFEFIDFLRQTLTLGNFDILIEARCRDLAVLRLMGDLKRFAPDLFLQVKKIP